MAANSFDRALHLITSIKLQEVEKQRLAYVELSKVLDAPSSQSQSPIDRVESLVEVIRSWTSSGSIEKTTEIAGSLTLENLDYWLLQAKNDPNFSQDVIKGWIEILETHIRQTVAKFDSAKLFGDLFTDWLASGDSSATEAYSKDVSGSDEASAASSFELVEEQEAGSQAALREKLKKFIFDDAPQFDCSPLVKYLDEIFAPDDVKEQLEILRRRVQFHADRFTNRPVSPSDLKSTLLSLRETSLLPPERRKALEEFLKNETLLAEVTSVINMRLKDLEKWKWPDQGLTIDMRKHELTGKLRAFMYPDLIDGILLHYVGISWHVKFKKVLQELYDSRAWKQTSPSLSADTTDRLTAQLGARSSISVTRQNLQRNTFLLNRLVSEERHIGVYDDVLDAPDTQREDNNSPMNVKLKILHKIITDSLLSQAVKGTFTMLQTDVQTFGPALEHVVIDTVLGYFGMPDTWRTFFLRFLQAPLREGEEGSEVKLRQRGTPIEFAISALMGELILFVMDFGVNQKSGGLFLYRNHDDIWIWDRDAERVGAAWQEMQTASRVLGLKFNETKTGSASVGPVSSNVVLPTGDVRWGFFVFNADKKRFVVNQPIVDETIVAMRKTLARTTSVFGWVNVYNKYMALFYRNFGKRPAACFGTDHINEMVDTFARIQRELFPDGEGAVGHLRKVIKERYGVEGLPEGYFYLPIGYGGLALSNPAVELIAVANVQAGKLVSTFQQSIYPLNGSSGYNTRRRKPAAPVTWDEDWGVHDPIPTVTPGAFNEDDVQGPAWIEPEEAFSRRIQTDGRVYTQTRQNFSAKPFSQRQTHPQFISFNEFVAVREQWLPSWNDTYLALQKIKEPRTLNLPGNVKSSVGENTMVGTQKDEWFHKWNFAMHGGQLIKAFGGVKAVDPGLIPTSMVSLYKDSRIAV